MKNKETAKKRIGLCFFLVLLLSGPAWAEDGETPRDFQEYTLGEIVVRGERPGLRQVSITTEVGPEEIKATHSQTVSEALTYVPGVQVTKGRKNEPNIQIHGFDQSQTLILIDGVPYYETNFGKLDLNQISTDNVARIDVIKGAASVLYGPNAEAGVINIITKKPTEKPSFSAIFEAGDQDATRLAISHGMKQDIFSYWVSYTHREWDAWKLSDDFEPRLGTVQYRPGPTTNVFTEDGGNFRDNSDYKSDNFWAKIGLEPTEDSEYYLNFHYIATEKGDPPSIDEVRVFSSRPAFSEFDRIEKYDDWGMDLSGRQVLTDEVSLQGKFFYHNHVDDYVSFQDQTFTTPIAVSRYKDYILGGMLLTDFRPVAWDTLKLAVHYKRDSHRERADAYLPFEESISYSGSVGLENECTFFGNRLSIVAGASYDWFDVTKAEQNTTGPLGNFTGQVEQDTPDMQELNPMIGANYRIDDATRIFASVARKTRFPTLQQLYSSKSGNVDLEAERSKNYTIGISRNFNEIMKVELAPFRHDISDRISRDAPGPLGNYQNYADVRMTGVEVNMELTPLKDLLLKASYTYNYARDRSSGRVTDKVTSVPKHKVDVRAQYTLPRVGTRLDLTMLYLGESYSQLPTPQNPGDPVLENDTYTIFNGKITLPFPGGCEAYVAVDNLFDEDYEPESGYPAPGRSFWLGFSFNY